jgi:hypothetical protein
MVLVDQVVYTAIDVMVAVSAGDGDLFGLMDFYPARKLMRKVIPESAMLKAQAPLRPTM